MVELACISGTMEKDKRRSIMNRVDVWYLTDYEGGSSLEHAIESLGFDAHPVSGNDFSKCTIDQSLSHVFIVDCTDISIERAISIFHDDARLGNFQKYLIVEADQVDRAISLSGEILNIDFISRPFNKREFLLLLEKAVIVEKYRDMMKKISKDAESRIEEFESLIRIHKKDVFGSEVEKEAFGKIMAFETKLVEEQKKMNNAIREFTALRQKELFEMKNRINAEELLDTYRRTEMIDAHETIRAQQAVLEFSSKVLDDANRIIRASEITGELSRDEAIRLHDTLKAERERGDMLAKEVETLKKQIAAKK